MGSVIAAIFTVIIKPFQYKDIAVLNVYFCMCAYVDGWMVCECTRVGQTLTEALFLYHLPPYCFEVGSPTESGAPCWLDWQETKPLGPTCLYPLGAWVTDMGHNTRLLCGC